MTLLKLMLILCLSLVIGTTSSSSSTSSLVKVKATTVHSQNIQTRIHSLDKLSFQDDDDDVNGDNGDLRRTASVPRGTFLALPKKNTFLSSKHTALGLKPPPPTAAGVRGRLFASVLSIPHGGANMNESLLEDNDDDGSEDDDDSDESCTDSSTDDSSDSDDDSSSSSSSSDESLDADDEKHNDDDLGDDNVDVDSSSSDDYDTESTDTDEEQEQEEEEDDEMMLKKEETNANAMSVLSKSVQDDPSSLEPYDEPLSLSAIHDLGITLGIMVLCNKLDLTNAKIIRYARFAFIAYVIAVQIFVLYVRYRAQANNDTTPITISNPLSSLLQQQTTQSTSSSADMVKNIANQLLSSTSTVMEYDLSQAKSMNSGLLFPMLMLWFLHFKMGQVQPLFFQTANGVKDFVMSPLFQVYVLGRNLERPFRNKKMEDLQKNQQESMMSMEMQEGDDEDENENESGDLDGDQDDGESVGVGVELDEKEHGSVDESEDEDEDNVDEEEEDDEEDQSSEGDDYEDEYESDTEED